jgi:hypothetical protein
VGIITPPFIRDLDRDATKTGLRGWQPVLPVTPNVDKMMCCKTTAVAIDASGSAILAWAHRFHRLEKASRARFKAAKETQDLTSHSS